MTSISETGHVKNVANFLKYNQFIATLGSAYNPAASNLTQSALSALHITAKTNLDNLKIAEDAWKDATNQREIAFHPLDTFSTQLLGLLKSTDAPQQTVNDFLFLVEKMRGASKKTSKANKANPGKSIPPVIIEEPTPTDPTVPTTISTSQQSFDQKLEHFAKMILLLQGVPTYLPNETETKILTLQSKLTTLHTLNDTATNATVLLKSARIARNTLFYSQDGMLDVIRKSKNYILAIFGKSSQQYKAAISFKFVRVVQKKKAK